MPIVVVVQIGVQLLPLLTHLAALLRLGLLHLVHEQRSEDDGRPIGLQVLVYDVAHLAGHARGERGRN